jgi:hypothetical protein
MTAPRPVCCYEGPDNENEESRLALSRGYKCGRLAWFGCRGSEAESVKQGILFVV